MSTELVDEIDNVNYKLTKYAGKYGWMYQITQDTGYVSLSEKDLNYIMFKIYKNK